MPRLRWWRRLDVPGSEEFRETGLTFQGRARVEEATPWTVAYRVTFDAGWTTLLAEASVKHPGGPRHLLLVRDPSGHWRANGREIERCQGALDVDLGMTPSTNTSAIRRLGLPVGESAELVVAWVRFPDLDVQPLRQRYTRLSATEYSYESLRDGVVTFHARLEVDTAGLVERYQGLFERVERAGPD
ncbi:MAG: putative glycolipid-binding domain-containing protein [Myxococcaceae bacterium]